MDNKYDEEVNKPFCWAAFESNKSILVQNVYEIVRIQFNFFESDKTLRSESDKS